MKKTIWTLAAMAGMACMGYDVPIVVKEKPKPRNCDKKKCKSCKHFRKALETERSSRCAIKGYTNPMDCACSHYAKRKK